MNALRKFFQTNKPPSLLRAFETIDDIEWVGGKGRSLQQLRSIGAPVPDGVILTTEFCHAILAGGEELPVRCKKTLDEIQNRFGSANLIVRSSAVGEDGQTAAFAGLLESIFPVDGRNRQALEDAVRRCVLSQRAPRVMAYEQARKVRLGGMAVVVQRLVDSVAAGVLFTDGVTLRGEWCRGQGQSLVDGMVTPGAFRLDRRVGRPAWVERLPEDGSAFPLDGRACTVLVHYATALERQRGVALDIEWALDASGALWLVQARPVTHRRTYLFSNANISENFPTPVVPLLASFARVGYEAYFRNLALEFGIDKTRIASCDDAIRGVVDVHGARLYYNLSHIHAVLRLMPFGDALVDSFDTFVGAGDSHPEGKPLDDELRHMHRVLGHVLRAYRNLGERIARFEGTVDDIAARFHPHKLTTMSLDELAAGLRVIAEIRNTRWIDASLADCAAAITYRALQALLRHQNAADPSRHHVLLEGLDVAGAWSLRALWDLALSLSANTRARNALAQSVGKGAGGFAIFRDALPIDLRNRVDDWLDRYGFRGSGELLLTQASLAEEPDNLLPLLQRYVQAALEIGNESPGTAFARQKALRERMTAHYRAGFAIPLRPVFDKLVLATQSSVKFRERARFRQALLYSRLRAIALNCGEKLVAVNTIDAKEDIFFLMFDELVAISTTNAWASTNDPRALIKERRMEHAKLSTLDLPDVFTLAAGDVITPDDLKVGSSQPTMLDPDATLVGVPASGGRVKGRAAVLEGLADADRLVRGDVLVARQTDPGWAPLFFLVRGLVLERGGMLSHGSILARELGIPSVVGVPNATTRITHGCDIAVDGNAGHVQFV